MILVLDIFKYIFTIFKVGQAESFLDVIIK